MLKPHINIKLRVGLPAHCLPHWEELITDKSRGDASLHPDVERALAHHRVSVWAAREYQPKSESWSDDEIQSGLDRVFRLILQQNSAIPAALIGDIELLPIVEYVRRGAVGHADLPSMEAAAMGATTDLASRQAIHLDEAHRLCRGASEVTVAVLDTGVVLEHPELANAMLPGRDFVDILDGADQFFGDYLEADEDAGDYVGHGCHVAGIIAGQGRAMPEGVVPRCKLLPVRVLGALRRGERLVGAGLVDNINSGVKWAVDNGADVINMSLGVRHTGGGLPHEEVVEYARRKGVTIIAASGNDGQEQLYYPGALPHVLAIGAVDHDGNVAPFSTFGEQVDFVAPGTDIYSTYLENGYAFSTGTSHAAPFVAGAVALLKSFAREKKGMRLSDAQVKHVLKHTADRVDQRFKNPKAGFGVLNLIDALRLLDHKLK